jgi:hypothetical protein
MLKTITKALAVSMFAGAFGLMAEGSFAATAAADPDDTAQEAPLQDDEDGGGTDWQEAPDGPPSQIGMLDGRDQQNYEDYLNGVSAGPVNVPQSRGGGYAPALGGGAPRRLPLPFVAPKGSTCGQMLATSVGGTMDNVVGMSTGPFLGFVGHNVLGPAAGNLVGGALVHLC